MKIRTNNKCFKCQHLQKTMITEIKIMNILVHVPYFEYSKLKI